MNRIPFSRRACAVALAASCYALFAGWTLLHDSGVVGVTKKNGFGCTCHAFAPADSVTVWIEGPARLRQGTQGRYTLLMTGGPAIEGGLNVAAGRGALAPADGTSQLLPSIDGQELTHTSPKAFVADTVRWDFFYTAPADTSLDTLFSVANSVNGNGIPTGDKWNFGANFIVDLTNDSVLAVGPGELPRQRALLQNYPNPFNPATTIRYELDREGFVELSVYDIRGRLVAALVRERQSPGVHASLWDAGSLPSGIYLYRLTASGRSDVRKMVLLR